MQSKFTWKTFDSYKKSVNSMWKVEMKSKEWEKSSCTCAKYLKQYVCKHILGIAINEGLYDVRPEAKNIPIGEKRKRGRPQRAKRALIVQ